MNKAVIVSGAAGAIGKAICTGFINDGYHVIGLDLPGKYISSEVANQEVDLYRFVKDDGYREQTITNIKRLLKDHGLYAIVNNAALQIIKPLIAVSAEDWDRTMAINLIAPFLLVQNFIDDLRDDRGSVVNIGSIHANQTKRDFTVYATSKAALIGLTRSMALELAPKIRVNAISPAAVDTPMLRAGFEGNGEAFDLLGSYHPVGRVAYPEEVFFATNFLVSPLASFITGTVLDLDGGIGVCLSDP